MCTGFSELNGSWKTYCTCALVLAERAAAADVDRLAVQHDRPVGGPLLAGQQLGHGGLARAALPHQRDDRALVQAEGDVPHRVQHRAAAQLEVLAEADRLQRERAARGGDRLDDGRLADLLGVRVDGQARLTRSLTGSRGSSLLPAGTPSMGRS